MGPAHFLIHLINQGIQLCLSLAQRIGGIAQHTLSRLFHALSQRPYPLGRTLFNALGFSEEIPSHQFLCNFQRLIQIIGACLTQGLVEFSGQQGLGRFRRICQVLHVVYQFTGLGLLICQLLRQRSHGIGIR